MDRGSRLVTCFQALEKLLCGPASLSSSKYSAAACKLGPDDLQQLRYLTSKILQYVAMQEKVHRDLVIKNGTNVELLLSVLENSFDTCSQQNVVYTLIELIGKTNSSKRVSTLVSHGAPHALLQTLVFEAKHPPCSDELLLSIHTVLSKLAPKDRKFAVKGRLTQAQGVTLSLLKSYCTNPKLLQPIVHVLKLYAANPVNASYLGKNGAVTYLFKVLAVCGRKYLILVKYVLDALGQLVKSKSGRKALIDAEGVRVLYSICQESLESRELESIVFMASLIMRKCFPKNRLPVACLRSAITCSLPESDFHVPDPGEGQVLSDAGDDNGYESSVDNDDDISSDDDPESHNNASDADGDLDGTSNGVCGRSWEDLSSAYKRFFAEQHEFDMIIEEEMSYGLERPIVIPTALFDSGHLNGQVLGLPQASQSAGGLNSTTTGRRVTGNHSAPSLLSVASAGDQDNILAPLLGSLGLQSSHLSSRDLDAMFNHQGGGQASKSSRSGVLGATEASSSSSIIDEASAVNLKTGSTIFTLDFLNGSKAAKKPPKARSKNPKSLSSTSSTSSKVSSSSAGKEKAKPKAKLKGTDDWFSSLSNSTFRDRDRDRNAEEEVIATETEEEEEEQRSNGNPSYEEPSAAATAAAATDSSSAASSRLESPDIYASMALNTHSLGRFNKLAYPDMYGSLPPPFREGLFDKKFGTQRQKIFEDIDRFINPDHTIDKVVFDLDSIVNTAGPTYTGSYSNLSNRDELRVSRQDETTDHLKFNSQFESGNLRKAIQIRKHEYDLILSPDVNTNHHHQWFYFEVSNMEAGVKYRFNIVNCEKLNSQFNFGMRPVMFSVAEAMQGRPHWVRAGTEICYYKNHFVRSSQTTGGVRGKTYYTTTFTVTFKHEKDVCYLAYHYPYTYTMLQYHLHRWESSYDSGQIYFRNQVLTETISGNQVPMLTITSHPLSYDRDGIEQLKKRPYIFLSSRVHPGESNSSWVMRGTINYLLSDRASAHNLRDAYVFKIVPMLNPDGVINGNHRCSVGAEDLNRRWYRPCPKLHPSIYHTKGLLQYMHLIGKAPLVYCDYHGHSRRKNVFLYGCSPSLSWMTEDVDNPAVVPNKVEDTGYKTLPKILHHMAPSFSLSNCSFMVEKSKESTARVVVWRQIGVLRSYTMESTYCGCDQGVYRGYHISTRELEEMGRKFCEALAKVRSRNPRNGMPGTSLATCLGETSGATASMTAPQLTRGHCGASTAAVAAAEQLKQHQVEPLQLPSSSSDDEEEADEDGEDEEEDEDEAAEEDGEGEGDEADEDDDDEVDEDVSAFCNTVSSSSSLSRGQRGLPFVE